MKKNYWTVQADGFRNHVKKRLVSAIKNADTIRAKLDVLHESKPTSDEDKRMVESLKASLSEALYRVIVYEEINKRRYTAFNRFITCVDGESLSHWEETEGGPTLSDLIAERAQRWYV